MTYSVRCCNEWCAGAETFAVVNEKPKRPTPCPVCGWLALPDDTAAVQYCYEQGVHEEARP